MFYFLLTLLILDGLLLMTVILLQSGKGGGLAAMGGAGAGSDTLFGTRQAATLLTKATWWTGGLFLALALILSTMSSRSARPESILRGQLQGGAAPAATAPALPGITEPAQPAGGGDAPAPAPGAADPAPGAAAPPAEVPRP